MRHLFALTVVAVCCSGSSADDWVMKPVAEKVPVEVGHKTEGVAVRLQPAFFEKLVAKGLPAQGIPGEDVDLVFTGGKFQGIDPKAGQIRVAGGLLTPGGFKQVVIAEHPLIGKVGPIVPVPPAGLTFEVGLAFSLDKGEPTVSGQIRAFDVATTLPPPVVERLKPKLQEIAQTKLNAEIKKVMPEIGKAFDKFAASAEQAAEARVRGLSYFKDLPPELQAKTVDTAKALAREAGTKIREGTKFEYEPGGVWLTFSHPALKDSQSIADQLRLELKTALKELFPTP